MSNLEVSMDDRHLEMLHRLDERVIGLVEVLNRYHEDDQAQRAKVRGELEAHISHTRNNHKVFAAEQQEQRLENLKVMQELREEHRREMVELRRRVEGLEGFRKYALALVGMISAAVTAVIHKLVAAWWS